MPAPTDADLNRGKQNLDALDAIVNGDPVAVVTTPGGRKVESVAKAISQIARPTVPDYATTAAALSYGVATISALVPGAGGANGTYPLAFSGGSGARAGGYFTVVGGAVQTVIVQQHGDSYTLGTPPAVSFAACPGLAGASATAVLGLNTTNGNFFTVPSASANGFLDLYQNVAGVATFVSTYPSKAAIDAAVASILAGAIVSLIGVDTVTGTSIVFTDEDGYASALRLTSSGDFAAPFVVKDSLGDTVFGMDDSGKAETLTKLEPFAPLNSAIDQIAYTDEDGYAALSVDAGGILSANVPPSAPAALPTPLGQIQHVVSYGQSLSLGSTSLDVLTTVQQNNSLKFVGGVRPFDSGTNPAVIYASFQPLVETYNSLGGGETSLATMFEMIHQLMRAENALDWADQDFRFLGSCAGQGGQPIAALSSGAYYDRFKEQIAYGKSLANAMGWEYRVEEFNWFQGEADTLNPGYFAALVALRDSLETYIQATTGFGDLLRCIMYQTYSSQGYSGGTEMADSTKAQVQAIETYPTKFFIAAPHYFMDHEGIHLTEISQAYLGAYVGLAYKRIILEGGTWSPTRPIKILRSGNDIFATFNVPTPPLEFDLTQVILATNYGFRVVTAGSAQLTINAVNIVGKRTVKLTLAAAVPAGARLQYGNNTDDTTITSGNAQTRQTGGGRGNLRDSQGYKIKFSKLGLTLPMHNWCVQFDKAVSN